MKEKFSVTGMTCSACSSGIERTLNKMDGVKEASVSLMGESMNVEYDENVVTREQIIAAVNDLGYGAALYDEAAVKKQKPQTDRMKKRFWLSLVFLVPLMYFSMGSMAGLPQPAPWINYTIQLVLTSVIIAINFRFFTSGTKALIKRVPNMDTLVALGSFASFAYSLVLTVLVYVGKADPGHTHMFYESAAMILTLVTLGKWLEEKSRRRTGEEVEKLIRLMPDTVTVERGDTRSVIAFADIAKGDTLIVRQGDYIPVDGKVAEGHAFIDRAAITGESMPVEVTAGDSVTGADIVKSGFLKVTAEKVGAETTLSQIVRMVKDAGASKAPIQKIADKIAGVFVPAVTLIALVTFVVWMLVRGEVGTAANYAISVLVISCPCALGLATPVAVMAATGRGMALGILYKDAEALQKARNINCVLLDKTATLTVGTPQVTDFELLAEEKEFVLGIAASVEAHSGHPIAECVKAYAEANGGKKGIVTENYRYETGQGAMASYNGVTYRLGNRKLLGNTVSKYAFEREKAYSADGKTAVFLADERRILAIFAVADTLKETSAEAVQALKDRKIRVAMLTGDNENVAKAIAAKVGIDEYFAEALPEDKAKAVERVREVGGYVAMVGDGINDSPALKTADVGVAMGTGTDIAIDSADVVLVSGDLNSVPTMVDLSKAAVRNIKENLFWAFIYNCIAIPVAAGVFSFANISLNPMIAAACMSLSSLFVVFNALRLMRFGKKKKTASAPSATAGGSDTPDGDKSNKFSEDKKMTKTLKIEGMMCNHCVMHVTKALEGIAGVEKADVDLKGKKAVVTLGGDVSDEAMKTAVADAGYEVTEIL